ncbi:MAG TPA: 3-hydroxyacyl-CoA dehydrogenase NAD-binding domain-containing protein, partial [Pyrinomonadaceae bacterium]|nr:3-hydroxyacyl-CoA dehydrogenase NAD-binding domain-containing protein [Pyrinomonadaceae bacterium]
MSESIGVVGSGTMGNGIAQIAATKNFDVIVCDIKEEFLQKAVGNIEKSLDRFVKKETMTEDDKKSALDRIKTTINLEELKDCALIVEAATENFDIKKQIFQTLDTVCSAETIL